MRAVLGVAIVLVFVLPLRAQTINGESNYEDGLSHITPEDMETRLHDTAKSRGPNDRGGAASTQPAGDK